MFWMYGSRAHVRQRMAHDHSIQNKRNDYNSENLRLIDTL